MEPEKFRIKVPVGLVLGEGPLPGLETAILCFMSSHRTERERRERAREGALVLLSPHKGTSAIRALYSHDLIQTHIQTPPYGGLGHQHMNGGWGTNIQSITITEL